MYWSAACSLDKLNFLFFVARREKKFNRRISIVLILTSLRHLLHFVHLIGRTRRQCNLTLCDNIPTSTLYTYLHIVIIIIIGCVICLRSALIHVNQAKNCPCTEWCSWFVSQHIQLRLITDQHIEHSDRKSEYLFGGLIQWRVIFRRTFFVWWRLSMMHFHWMFGPSALDVHRAVWRTECR